MRVLTEIDRDAIGQLIARDEFFWLDVTAPAAEDLERLRHELGLEAPPEHVPGMRRRLFDDHEEYVVLVWRGADVTEDGHIEPFDVLVYVAGSFIVSYHDIEVEELDRLHRRLTRRGQQEEQLVVARVLDAVTDSFLGVLSTLDELIAALEDQVLERPSEGQLHDVARLQRELLSLRRVVNPQRDLLLRVADVIADVPGLEEGSRDYLREVADDLARISSQIDNYGELLTAATDIYLSTVSNRLNEVTRKLTIVATIFLPLTFVTGFFGQNFTWMVDHVDSLTAFLVLGIGGLAVAIAMLVVWFRRSGYI
ncbi:MAG: magnesium transporter CorA family protein [Solirubrobacteraceae bacterium]